MSTLGRKIPPIPDALRTFARDMRSDQTGAEYVLWQLVRARRFGGFKFRRQHAIDRYILDFYCHEVRLAVELDGGQHDQQAALDLERTGALARFDIEVLRFWNREVLVETVGVLERLWAVMHERAALTLSPDPSPSRGRGTP